MQIAAVTDIITHFAGLMHLHVEPERAWHRPDGGPGERHHGADNAVWTPHERFLPDVDDAGSAPIRLPRISAFDDHLFKAPKVSFHAAPHPPAPHMAPVHYEPQPPIEVGAGGGGGNGGDGTNEQLWQGADQTVVDAHQVNMLISDVAYVDHDAGAVPYASDASLQHLIDQAYAAIPASAPVLGGSDSQELGRFKSFEDGLATAPHHADTLTDGTWTDGSLSSSDGSAVALTLPVSGLVQAGQTADGVAPGRTIVLGHDVAANESLIFDTSAAPLTTIVMGDAYTADLIVQSNVVRGAFAVATNAPDAFVQAVANDGDTVSNVARFQHMDAVVTATIAGASGQTWNVQVVNGDFYDVNASTQQNVTVNDVTYAGAQQSDHYYAVLGGNTQINQFEFTHDAPSYDLLIVLGNSYVANAIYQENVLLDDGRIGVTFAGSDAANGTQSLSVGHDAAANDASITAYGTSAWSSTSQALQDLVKSLVQQGDAAPGYPGIASTGTTINVMIVTGDYYHLNLVSQTNVVANGALALADLSGTGIGIPTSVSAGHNTLSNSAAIVTAGTLNAQYVTGHAYETAMLVQTNIVSAHADLVPSTPNTLVPELVAFLDTGSMHAGHVEAATPPTTEAHHHDGLA